MGEEKTASEVPGADDEQADEAAPVSGTDSKLKLPKQELTGEMLYGFLLGDMADKRGNKELAAQAYLELADLTQDPRVAGRAAQLAFESRQVELAVKAFTLWVKLEPESVQAKQLLLNVLITGDRLEETRPYIADMLASHPEQGRPRAQADISAVDAASGSRGRI